MNKICKKMDLQQIPDIASSCTCKKFGIRLNAEKD